MSYTPQLVEPGVMYFLNNTLKQCHEFKVTHYNTLANICMFILFVVGLSLLLLYRYKGKPTFEEVARREFENQQYILSKIRNFQEDQLKDHQQLITGLPHYSNLGF